MLGMLFLYRISFSVISSDRAKIMLMSPFLTHHRKPNPVLRQIGTKSVSFYHIGATFDKEGEDLTNKKIIISIILIIAT